MRKCLDTDQVVSLGTMLDWDVKDRLAHILQCTDCQNRLEEVRAVYTFMHDTIEPRPEFVSEILQALPGASPKSAIPSFLVSLLNTLLASVTSFFAIALLASGAPHAPAVLPVAFVSLLVGICTLAWNTVGFSLPFR